MKRYAVLTGDLIESRALAAQQRKDLLDWLKQVTEHFSQLHHDVAVGRLEVFRGDSWQLCLQKPTLALEAAVFIRAGLKAHTSRENVDTRIGIGVGSVDTLVEDRISESNGEAFIRSGQALDALHPDVNLSLEWPDGPEAVAAISQMALPLLDLAMSHWTHAESVAVYGALRGWTQQQTAEHEIARKPDGSRPSRQAIAKALGRVHWSSHLEPVLKASCHLMT